ncbi:MAG: Amidophosphoribosyltransferase [Candidatus Thorarchaeota archaeon]|nr:MAG: Amidophosphoribosyltransferase [Candidatus Thorarchaeota archaeon]
MCDLLALSFNLPITPRISLDNFQLRGEPNPDGWGLAFYHESLLRVLKEPISAKSSKLFDFAEIYPTSTTFVSHVRRSTEGVRSYANTHPFYRQITTNRGIQEWAFAHNGTLTEFKNLQLRTYQPIGTTDSEHAFCYILDAIAGQDISSWKISDFQRLQGIFQEINDSDNTFNCLLTNGAFLFCYSDEQQHNNGLRYLPKSVPTDSIEFTRRDESFGMLDVMSGNLESNQQESGYVIVTRALTAEEWIEFNPGELIVFQEGKIIFPYTRMEQ